MFIPAWTMFSSYVLLYLTVIALWLPKKSGLQIWHFLLIASIGLALINGQIDLIGLIPIMLLAIVIYYSRIVNNVTKILCYVLTTIICIGLTAHWFPGFHNLKIINQVYISENAIPYTMYLNFDKTLVGIFILGMSHSLISNQNTWIRMFKQTFPIMLIIIVSIIIFALLLGLVRFDPKLPNSLFLWIITNLLFVCTAEEAFFRGFIQKNLAQAFDKIIYGNYIAIFCAAILFGLAHFMGGFKYILLATISGVGFGFVYHRTKYLNPVSLLISF